MKYLDGTEIDYQVDGLSAVFKFKNPNSKDECGCGESFTVDCLEYPPGIILVKGAAAPFLFTV